MKYRLFFSFLKSFRWFFISVIFKKFLRFRTKQKISTEAKKAQNSLPKPVASVVASLPEATQKSVHTTLAVVRSGKKTAQTTKNVLSSTRKNTTGISNFGKNFLQAFSVRQHVEDFKKQVSSDYLSARGDIAGATDSLLDKKVVSEYTNVSLEESFTVADIPKSVQPGRRKARPSRRRQVKRVQRTRNRTRKPWE